MAHRLALPIALAAAGLTLAGCASTANGVLNTQAGQPTPTCRVHQTQLPGHAYTAGDAADPRSILALMHYYTAIGTKIFCDSKPPTPADHDWMKLYTKLGGSPRHLAKP